MQTVLRIFRKELKDTLRDRRTILMMVVMPLVVIPLLITLIFKVQAGQIEKAEAARLRIAFEGREYAPELFQRFLGDPRFDLVEGLPVDSLATLTQREFIDGAVIVTAEFPERVAADQQGTIRIIYKSAGMVEVARNRMTEVIEAYDQEIVGERITRLKLDPQLFDAVAIERTDVVSVKEKIGKLAGGYLPYLFIIFGFMGAMYPGIDLGAGEKERGTLETILSSPASRLEIVFGKFLVVMLASVLTALISMGGLYFAVQQFTDIPPEIIDAIMEMLSPGMIGMILTLMLPISALFAALILGLSIFARSFKEAQSIITPLNLVVIFPAVIGTIPGIELSATTALVPVLNVALATKEMLAGTADPVLLAEVYLSLVVLAGLAIFACVKWFQREEVLFRS